MSISVFPSDPKALQPSKDTFSALSKKSTLQGSQQSFDAFMEVMDVDYTLQREQNDTASDSLIEPDSSTPVITDGPVMSEQMPQKQNDHSTANNDMKSSAVEAEEIVVTESKVIDEPAEVDSSTQVLADIVHNKDQSLEQQKNITPVAQVKDPSILDVSFQQSVTNNNLQVEDATGVTPTVDVDGFFVIEFEKPVLIDVATTADAATAIVEQVPELVIPMPDSQGEFIDMEQLVQAQEQSSSVDMQKPIEMLVNLPQVNDVLVQVGDDEQAQKPILQQQILQQNSQSSDVNMQSFKEAVPEILDMQVFEDELVQVKKDSSETVADPFEEALFDEDPDMDIFQKKDSISVATVASETTALSGESGSLVSTVKGDSSQSPLQAIESLQSMKDSRHVEFKQRVAKPAFQQLLAQAKQSAESYEPPFNTKLLRRLELTVRDPSGTIQLDIAQEEASIHIKCIAPPEALSDLRVVGEELQTSLQQHGLSLGSYEMTSNEDESGSSDNSISNGEDGAESSDSQASPVGTGSLINQRV